MSFHPPAFCDVHTAGHVAYSKDSVNLCPLFLVNYVVVFRDGESKTIPLYHGG